MREGIHKQLLKLKKKVDLVSISLFLVILIGIFFRFYNTPERYSLSIDSSRDAMVAIVGAEQVQFPLTGPFSSAGQFTFGPWYYYQLIVFSLITPFRYAPWIYMGILSTAFIVVMYKLGELLFDRKFGLLVAVLVALSPYAINTAVGLSNPYVVSFFAGLSLILFVKILKGSKSLLASLCMGFFLGIGINSHYQMLGYLWIIPLIFILKKQQRFVMTLYAGLGVCVSFIPLLIFDLLNHWFTFRHLSEYYLISEGRIYVPTRWLFYLRDFWPSTIAEILGVPSFARFFIFGSIGVSIIWLIYKRKISLPLLGIGMLFFINFVMLRYYWGEKFIGYIQYFFPFIYVAVVLPFWLLSSKKFYYIGIILFIGFVSLILPKSVDRLDSFLFDQEMKKEAKSLIQNTNGHAITVYDCGDSRDKSQAIALLLKLYEVPSEKGKKIGYPNVKCTYPIPGFNSKTDATPAANLIYSHFPPIKNVNALDLSEASDAGLMDFNWEPLTSESVYDSTIKWWYEEKP